MLESYYQIHVTNTLSIILKEKREEEKSHLSTNQDEANLEDLGDEQEDESSLGPQDGKDDFESTCVEENEAMESEAKTDLTSLKGITPNDSPFDNLKEGNPISCLEDDIGNYFRIEKEKWEIVGPQFNYAPIYDTDKEDEVEIGFHFILGIICDDTSIDTLGKENCYFPLHEEGQLEGIDSPFNENPIFDAYNEEINENPTYAPYDYIFKSLDPLYYGEGKPFEYHTSPSALLFFFHHLDSSSSKSLFHFSMTSSDHASFPLSEYGVKE